MGGGHSELNGGLGQCGQRAAMHSPVVLETERWGASCALGQCPPQTGLVAAWFGLQSGHCVSQSFPVIQRCPVSDPISAQSVCISAARNQESSCIQRRRGISVGPAARLGYGEILVQALQR